MKQIRVQYFTPAERRKERHESVSESVFFSKHLFLCQRRFALFGQTTFYTKRNLENIDEANLPAYLKEVGWAHIAVATVFLIKTLLNVAFPGSRPALYGFLLALLVCVYFLEKINTKYKK